MAEKETASASSSRYDFTKLNTLSVVSLATSVSGFGAVAGIITGHIALTQIKQSKENGRGLAIAGLAVGYGLIGLAIVGTIVRLTLRSRYGVDFGGFGVQMGDDRNGGMGFGGHGQIDFGQGQQNGQITITPNSGGMMNVDPNGGAVVNGQQMPMPMGTATPTN